MSGTSALRTRWLRRPPAAGAAVMATGILSVGFHLTGYDVLSVLSLALTAAAWVGLAADVTLRLLGKREKATARTASPTALAVVPATTVLGQRVSAADRRQLAEALLALAFVLWAGLAVPVMRRWHRRMPGAVFLGCVAAQGLAALGAALAAAEGVAWLAHLALVFFWLGLVLDLVGLWCFDLRQVVTGAGDHWVAGGALAISALAGSQLIAAAHSGLYLWNEDDNGVLRAVTVALFVLACTCACLLAVAESVRPRLRYDARRWATAFPLGMTAVAALSMATVFGVSWLRGLGQVLLWIAVAVWCVVLAGAARAGLKTLRSTAPQ